MADHKQDDSGLLEALQGLLDKEAIRELQYEYARIMDEGFCHGDIDADALAALWTEDGAWDGGSFGRYVGRQAIADFFRRHALDVNFANHYAANEQVSLSSDGKSARARSLVLVPVNFLEEAGPVDHWMFVAWHNSFSKQDGRWYFTELTSEIFKQGFHLAGAKAALS